MHKRQHHVEVDTATVYDTNHMWFDPRDGRMHPEKVLLFISTHEQGAVKVSEDTHPTDRHGIPYNWDERRVDVIERAGENIKDWVQPLGYVEAMRESESTTEKVLLGHEARQAEIEYLASTQDRELAPQWLELRENGITAIPFERQYAEEELSFGETVSEEEAREMLVDYTIMGIKDGNRVEEFLRESDYAYVQNYLPKRYQWVAIGGKRGFKTNFRADPEVVKAKILAEVAKATAPSAEDIEGLAALRTEMAARRELYGKDWLKSLLTPEEWDEYVHQVEADKFLDTLDPERLDIAAAYEQEDYEAIRPKIGDPCPKNCLDGRLIVGITVKRGRKSGEEIRLIDYDDCATCNGRGTVMAALGFAPDIWEGVEYEAEDQDPVLSDNLWEFDFENLNL